MKILTFDTSLNKLYVTLSEDGVLLESKIIESTPEHYHSAFLLPTILEILKKHDLIAKNIDLVGVNIGPGSFTGIRACCTVARVMGQSVEIPVIGVSSLEILAKMNKCDKPVVILMDARKGKSYYAKYINGEEIVEPCAIEYNKAFEKVKSEDCSVICDKRMVKMLSEENIEHTNFEEIDFDFGKCLAELAYKHFNTGKDFNWAKLKPLYIQPPPISMPKA